MNNIDNTATQKTKTNENNEALSNLIQSIQSKLNEKEINKRTALRLLSGSPTLVLTQLVVT